MSLPDRAWLKTPKEYCQAEKPEDLRKVLPNSAGLDDSKKCIIQIDCPKISESPKGQD